MEHNYPFPAITDRWTSIFKQIDSVTKTSHHPPAKFETAAKIKKDEEARSIAADEEHLLRND